MQRNGISSPEQLISFLSTNGSGADNLASNADVTSGAQRGTNGLSAANLRGQGSAATLVLLNGRRVAAHGLSGSAVDVNQIPFAAIERIEVLKDGASAIYGTDAVGGVINFITKKNYRGFGATAQVAAAGTAASSTPSASPAAILAGQRTAAVVTTPPATAPAPVPTTVVPPRPAMPSDASRIRMQAGMRHLVVAIDPGHGGQDPGAIGPTGKREKDVTLAVARELARQVNATPGLKAYLTRDSDVFIPLPMRAQKARANKADIFISIHADAAENRSATGSSVYVLSTKGASSQRARWLADKENAADLVGGVRLQQTEGTLANVLLDLAQSGYMKASEDAAGHVLGGLKRIGNNHKPNIERANFAVLRTSDMPAMLVETAFISNPDEERRLIDPAYQRKIAGAVLDGVHTFFSRQPPPGTLYAARAQAEIDAAGTMAGGSK